MGKLTHPGIVWKKLSPDTRLKIQWFKFPSGIIFDGTSFRTTEICRVFKPVGTFFNSNSYRAPSKILSLNTPETGNLETIPNELYNTEELAEAVGNELIELSKILSENPSKQGNSSDPIQTMIDEFFSKN